MVSQKILGEEDSKKKALITILGTIGGSCDRDDPLKGSYRKDTKPAMYDSKIDGIDSVKAVNTLPLLIKTFSNTHHVIALHTSCAKDIQSEVIKRDPDIRNFVFEEDWLIEDDLEFDVVFRKIDSLIEKYDSIIIDVSHGFRHLPILMIIDVVMHNIEAIGKIEKIIFARQIEQSKYYELIDLKRYLDLSNIAYALTTFTRNYTVANNIAVDDKSFNTLLNDLSSFSQHILANSLDELLKDTNKQESITRRLITQIENLQDSKGSEFDSIERLLGRILDHLKEIYALAELPHYLKHYKLSENMYQKGYYLNAVTLLSEAIGMYCSLAIKNLFPEMTEKMEIFEKRALSEKNNSNTPYKLYELYNQSKTLYKINSEKYRGHFLKVDTFTKNRENKKKLEGWNAQMRDITPKLLKSLKQNEKIRELTYKIDDLRNNLAHANSSQRLKEVQEDIEGAQLLFKKLCIDDDILGVSQRNR